MLKYEYSEREAKRVMRSGACADQWCRSQISSGRERVRRSESPVRRSVTPRKEDTAVGVVKEVVCGWWLLLVTYIGM